MSDLVKIANIIFRVIQDSFEIVREFELSNLPNMIITNSKNHECFTISEESIPMDEAII